MLLIVATIYNENVLLPLQLFNLVQLSMLCSLAQCNVLWLSQFVSAAGRPVHWSQSVHRAWCEECRETEEILR